MHNIALTIKISTVEINGDRITGTASFGNNYDFPLTFACSKYLEQAVVPGAVITTVADITTSRNKTTKQASVALWIKQAQAVIPGSMPINSITLFGRLGEDPETKHGDGEKKDVTKCDIAVSIAKGVSNWYPLVAYGKTGDTLANYTAKGHQVCVEGRLQLSTWTDKETKQPCSKVEVTLNSVTLVSQASS